MKLYKTLLYVLMILPALLLQSCLKDQEDIFDTPSSIRMQEVLDNAKKVLTSSEEGWAFDYYPDRNLAYGGYAYTVKFDNQKVTVGSELAPGTFESSLYKLTNDNGPILSFDSYNTLMHYFATPSSAQYEGLDGDFEFIIMEVTDNLITLRGKRTGNTMYMHRLTKSAATYIENVYDICDNIIFSSANGTLGSSEISCAIDVDARQMDITYMNGEKAFVGSGSFIPTETGIHFYTPIELNGATLTDMDYNIDTSTFSGKDSKGNEIILVGIIAEEYTRFKEFEGKYDFNYYYGTLEVTLVPDNDNNCYLIKGLNENYNIVANFVKSKGYLNITSQKVGDSGNQQIWLLGWSADTGYLSWSTECGMYLVKDIKQESTFNFVTNTYLDTPADSFILNVFNGAPSSTTRVGAATAPWLINDSYQVPYPESIVKK